jgi:hypothetical protein
VGLERSLFTQSREHWHDTDFEACLRLLPRLTREQSPVYWTQEEASAATWIETPLTSMQSQGGGGGGPKRESEPAVVIARVISVGPAPVEPKSAAAALAELDIPPAPVEPQAAWGETSDSDWDTPAVPEASMSDWSATPYVPDVAMRAAEERPVEPSRVHSSPVPPPVAPAPSEPDAFFDASGSYHPAVEPDPWPSRPPPTDANPPAFDVPRAAPLPTLDRRLEPIPMSASSSAPSSRSPHADSVPAPAATFTEPAPAPASEPGLDDAPVPPPVVSSSPAIEDDLAALEASMEAAEQGVWKEESFDELFDELDTGFDALLDPGTKRKSVAPATSSHVFDDAKRLFSELAASHMRHVKDFVLDLTWGPATSDWLGLCTPASQSLKAGATQFELHDLVRGLDGLVAALENAGRTGLPTVEGKAREEILEAYKVLAATLPEAFTLDSERKDREGIIVKSLLEQVEDVRKVQQDKLFAAGLMALDVLFSAKPKDVADTTGLSMELAARISARFKAYKEDVSHIEVDPTRRGEWGRLASNLHDLETYHRAYEQANDAGHAREKKSARKQREMALLDVKIMLARLGEAQALYSIERAAFSGKIEYLRRLLREKEETLRISLL